jgi:hypothetical protein
MYGGPNILGILFVAAWMLFFLLRLRSSGPFRATRDLVILALALRIVGALARHYVLVEVYDGVGDAAGYYEEGLEIAERVQNLDLGFFAEEQSGFVTTQRITILSGFVLAFIGPTLRGEFVVFSFMSFWALVFFVRAHHSANRGVDGRSYVMLVLLWPSLWFWPCSVGKEAVVLLGAGLATWGYVGRNERIRWLPAALGIGIIFAIRPHVATVFVASAVFAEWVGRRGWTFGRVLQALVIAAILLFVGIRSAQELGLGAMDLEGAREFMAQRSQLTEKGGSNIGAGATGLLAVPMAFINILMRPFVFEAHNAQALLSGLEMMFFWALVFVRRKRIVAALRGWRHNRMLRFALPMSALYILMIGLTFSNLGIIARQRVLVLPFLFAILIGLPERSSTNDRPAKS